MKIKPLITLWFVLVSAGIQFAYAQTAANPVIDSLTSQLAKHVRNDTVRATILNKITYQYRHVDNAKGMAYGQQALDLVQKLKWEKGMGIAYYNLSVNCLSDNPKATGYALKAFAINQRYNNHPELMLNCYTLGSLFFQKNDYQKALAFYNLSLKYCVELKDKDKTAYLNIQVGDSYRALLDTAKAMDYYKRGLVLCQAQKDTADVINLQLAMGNIYLNKGDMLQARNAFQQEYNLNVAIGDKAGYSDGLWNIGATYLSTDFDKALSYYNKALKLKEELHDYANVGAIYSILADHDAGATVEKKIKYYTLSAAAYQQAGDKADASDKNQSIGLLYIDIDASKALEYLLPALKIKDELHNYAASTQIAIKISDVYTKQENSGKAIEYYKIAADDAVKANDKENQAGALWALGTLYLPIDAERSVAYYKQAAEIEKGQHNYTDASALAQNIGSYYLEKKDYNSALDYYSQELKFSLILHDHALITRSIMALGAIYRERDGVNKMTDYYNGLLANTKNNDVQRADILYIIGTNYLAESNFPKSLGYFFQALQIVEEQKDQSNTGHILESIGNIYTQQKNFDKAMDYYNRSYKAYAANHETRDLVNVMIEIANCYTDDKNYDKAIAEYMEAEKQISAIDLGNREVLFNDIANSYRFKGEYEKAADYITRSLKIARTLKNHDYSIGVDLSTLAEIYIAVAKNKNKPIPNDTIFPKDRKVLLEKALAYIDQGLKDVKKNGDLSTLIAFMDDRTQADELLGNYTAAYADYKQYIAYRDSIFNESKNQDITRRELQYQYGKQEDSLKYQQVITGGLLKQQTLLATQKEQQLALLGKQKDLELLNTQKTQAELLAEQSRRKANEQQLKASQKEQALAHTSFELQNIELKSKRSQSYYFMAGIGSLMLISVFIGRNYYNQRVSNRKLSDANALIITANEELAGKQEEITVQRDQLSTTLNELKGTQRQLIQSEKMASLGELTAGIAHEIQNPLNFVNNFSEVSVELLEDLIEEAKAGRIADVLELAGDLTQNLSKIHHHGKRADFIVKGMLEHSRTSTGQRQLTNVNILADEFFKLSYHAMRTKDKAFNAELISNLNNELPKVSIVQQDIGRVLLNVFNNAFYAVHQKQKTAGPNYKPIVEVSTTAKNDQYIITVKDNGNGIPDNIKEKIMQPFFTTKPTGEGTGLGLSLSYDIVVKGHEGAINVNSKEGEFTEFIITLPLNNYI